MCDPLDFEVMWCELRHMCSRTRNVSCWLSRAPFVMLLAFIQDRAIKCGKGFRVWQVAAATPAWRVCLCLGIAGQ